MCSSDLGSIVHSLGAPFRRRESTHPDLALVGYALFGIGLGAVSLWAFPDLFIEARWLRVVNLMVTPVLAGLAMSALGALRRRRGMDLVALDTFRCGFAFAFGMALVRFIWGG